MSEYKIIKQNNVLKNIRLMFKSIINVFGGNKHD